MYESSARQSHSCRAGVLARRLRGAIEWKKQLHFAAAMNKIPQLDHRGGRVHPPYECLGYVTEATRQSLRGGRGGMNQYHERPARVGVPADIERTFAHPIAGLSRLPSLLHTNSAPTVQPSQSHRRRCPGLRLLGTLISGSPARQLR
jgi:hypothetical protein